jgi:hypothetical protein
MTRLKRILALFALASYAVVAYAGGMQKPSSPLSDWRPARDTAGVRYVGSAVCAQCHSEQSSTYAGTPMARAAELPAESEVLAGHPRLTFREGPYTYQIARQGNRTVYTVSDGAATISAPILVCFGKGVSGQTYIFTHEGSLYESRVSYFKRLGGLGITILHPREVPKSLAEAIGRRMNEEGARGCFSCHTTGAVDGARFEPDRLVAGIGCEACHGPGENHLAAVRAKNFKELQIFNPARLDSIDLTQDVCGSCHMSFDKVMMLPDQGGLNNIRFQPYRVFKSGAHFMEDARLSCVACHDPHDKTRHDAAYYDSRCLACHVSSPSSPKTPERSAAPCPTATTKCVTCHMPKVDLPEMHAEFTDHWIRIVRPGEPVPR